MRAGVGRDRRHEFIFKNNCLRAIGHGTYDDLMTAESCLLFVTKP
jgi:hypothetical protein